MTRLAAPPHLCPACTEQVGRHDRYCEACGQNLLVHRTPIGGPVAAQEPPAATRCATCQNLGIDPDGFCEWCGRAQPAPRDHVAYDLGLVAGVSDRGRRRERNEDSLALGWVGRQSAPRAIVAVVCDGVASSSRGAEASQLAADTGVDALLASVIDDQGRTSGSDPAAATASAAAAASTAVAGLAAPHEHESAPSTTYVSAVVTHSEVTIGWVGDSRAYWLPAGGDASGGRCLTTDHTRINELVAAGVSEAVADADSEARALSRWLGADAFETAAQVVTFRPAGPGTVVLCSDGLWGHLPAVADLADGLTGGVRSSRPPEDPAAAAGRLTSAALGRGGRDNIAVVAMPFPFRTTAGGQHAHAP